MYPEDPPTLSELSADRFDDAVGRIGNRHPYVGEGLDGIRRSAQVDREELATLDDEDPRTYDLRVSIAAWEAQEARLMAEARGTPLYRVDPATGGLYTGDELELLVSFRHTTSSDEQRRRRIVVALETLGRLRLKRLEELDR